MANQENKGNAKPNFFVRFLKAVKKFFVGVGHFFKNMYFELKKVTWPSKHDMINYCVVVFVFMILMGVVIGLFDLGAGALVDLIVS